MFSKLVITGCIVNTSSANVIQREPLMANVGGIQQPNEPDYPVDYFVPNYGMDREIETTQKNLAQYEKTFKHQLSTSGPKEADIARDYFIPDFGADRDIVTTQKNLNDWEVKFNHQLSTTGPKEADIPRDYFVPSFGVDRDILTTQKNLGDWELKFKHQLSTVGPKEKDIPRDYFVPDFGIDRDIITTQKNIGQNELKFKHQLSTVGPKEADIPKDYFIPDFGLDRDIVWTQGNLAATEKKIGVWNVEENVMLWIDQSREPLLSHEEPVPEGELDYGKIHSLGQDYDVSTTLQNMNQSQKKIGYKWQPHGFQDLPSSQIEFNLLQQGETIRREGYKPPTLEDLKPKVPHVDIPDEEVEEVSQSLAESEQELGQKFTAPFMGGERQFYE